jgi:NADH-quinone oxidoreductase subunit J
VTRRLLVILTLLVGVVIVSGAIAHAQPTPPPGAKIVIVPPATPGVSTPATDVDTGSGSGMALLFWVFAGVCVAGSVFVITRRNLIAAVMGMVGTFFALAVLYMMLYASFLAVIQMLVYAGAIMVLFVFVVMVLNKPEDEPWGLVGLPGKILAGLAMLYLLARVVMLFWSVTPPDQKLAAEAPPQVAVSWRERPRADDTRPTDQQGLVPVTERYDFGSTAAVGNSLFGDYVFPFEAISILLLIAVVGAIAIARPLKDDEPDAAASQGSSGTPLGVP